MRFPGLLKIKITEIIYSELNAKFDWLLCFSILNYESCLEAFEREFDMSFSNNWNKRLVRSGCVSHFDNTGIGVHFRIWAPVLNMPAARTMGLFSLRIRDETG